MNDTLLAKTYVWHSAACYVVSTSVWDVSGNRHGETTAWPRMEPDPDAEMLLGPAIGSREHGHVESTILRSHCQIVRHIAKTGMFPTDAELIGATPKLESGNE